MASMATPAVAGDESILQARARVRVRVRVRLRVVFRVRVRLTLPLTPSRAASRPSPPACPD